MGPLIYNFQNHNRRYKREEKQTSLQQGNALDEITHLVLLASNDILNSMLKEEPMDIIRLTSKAVSANNTKSSAYAIAPTPTYKTSRTSFPDLSKQNKIGLKTPSCFTPFVTWKPRE